MLKYYFKLTLRYIRISWQNKRTFNFEFLMMLIHLVFNFAFVIIFWGTLLMHIGEFGDWSFADLALYSGISFLSGSIGRIFLGLSDMPQRILGGHLDKYLVRPINTLFAVICERMPIVYAFQQLIISLILIITIVTAYGIRLKANNVLLSFFVLMIGVIIYHSIYGIVTCLAFWLGRIGTFRSLVFGLAKSKQYPVVIFPKGIQIFLTYIIPVTLISYYPTIIFLGKMTVGIGFFIKFIAFMFTVSYCFLMVWKKGLKRYEANGG